MDPTTGRLAPCPNCGSTNVRWRNRRLYDFVFTWTRFAADTVLSTIFVGGASGRTTGGVSSPYVAGSASPHVPEWQLRNQPWAIQYNQQRSMYEAKVGLAVAKRFWRCPDCRQKGQVFSGLDETLTTDRAALASMEDRIVGDLGSISNRVDRDGIPDK